MEHDARDFARSRRPDVGFAREGRGFLNAASRLTGERFGSRFFLPAGSVLKCRHLGFGRSDEFFSTFSLGEHFVAALRADEAFLLKRINALPGTLGERQSGTGAGEVGSGRIELLRPGTLIGKRRLCIGRRLKGLRLSDLRIDFGERETRHRVACLHPIALADADRGNASGNLRGNGDGGRVHHALKRHGYRRHRLPDAPADEGGGAEKNQGAEDCGKNGGFLSLTARSCALHDG